MRVFRLLNNTKKNQHSRNIDIWDYVLRSEIEHGSTFMRLRDGSLYIFLGLTREISFLAPSIMMADRVMAYLNQLYGLSADIPAGRFIYNQIRSHVGQHGVEVELRRFSCFDKRTLTAYISNYDGRMWRLDGGTPELVNNGEDDVYFADDDGGRTCTPEPDIAPHGILLDRLTNLNFAAQGLSGITPEQQRKAMIAWMFALAFPDRVATKPLLLMEGTQGAGKSASIMLMQTALLGAPKPMILNKSREDDFAVQLLRSPIAMFDNTDTFVEWVPDAVCSYATLGYWVRRKLYTTSDEAIIKPQSFVAIASKNPSSFRREDVADRILICRLERWEHFKPFEQLSAEILADRPQLFGEYLYYINLIVEHLRVYNDAPTVAEKSRMADYAAFARVVGAVLHWPTNAVDDMLEAIDGERDAFINEDDPLVQILGAWLNTKRNQGRKMNANELFNELTVQASQLGVNQLYKNARTLAQKLRSPHIARSFHTEITIKDNHKVYQFWPLNMPVMMPGTGTPTLSEPGDPSLLSIVEPLG